MSPAHSPAAVPRDFRFGIMRHMKKDELLKQIRDTLAAEFGCDAAKVVPEARFFEDLDLDSIDAVDLIVRLRNEHRIDVSPDDFKSIRTIGDLIDVLERLTESSSK